MCIVIEHDILEISKMPKIMGVKSNAKKIALRVVESINKRDVVSKHHSCTHSGECGTHAHGSGGGGWCYFCDICNP